MNWLAIVFLSQNPAWWPTYGCDLANTHFSPLRGAMSSVPSTTWQYNGAGYVERSPATAEIGDGDPYLETLVPGYNTGTLALVDGVNQTVQWTRSLGANPISTAGMYNLDADLQLECVVSISNGVGTVCLDGLTGNTQWTFASATTWGSAKVADFDHDGNLEIIVGGASGLYCLSAAGTQEWLASVGTVNSTPAAADVDGDGWLEIAVGSATTLAVLEGESGAIKWSTSVATGYSSPVVKDVTGDGVADVVVGGPAGVVYCRDALTGASRWSVTLPYNIEAGVAAWDIDGDDTVEVVVGCNNSGNTGGYLYCINGRTGAVGWTYPTNYGVHRAVSLADVNSDNQVEILLPGCKADGSNTLKCLSSSGSLLWQVALSTAHDIHDPSNADIDGDDCAELVIGTYGVDAAWFLDDPGDSSGCGATTVEEDPGITGGKPARLWFDGVCLRLSLPAAMQGELAVFDVSGRRIATLLSGAADAGEFSFNLPALPAGIYTCAFIYDRGTVSCPVPVGR